MPNPDYVGRHNEDYVFDYDPNEDAWTTDLSKVDISRGERFRDNNFWPFFERMRKEDPGSLLPGQRERPVLVHHQVQ